MFSVILVLCLLAGGLGAKLPAGPEHRSLGHHSAGHSQGLSLPQGGGQQFQGNNGFSASFDSDGAGFTTGSAGFRQGGGSGGSFASASGSRQGAVGFSGSNANAGLRQGQNSISGGYQGGQAGFGGQASSNSAGNGGGQYDNGLYQPQNLEAQFDNGEYRADELNAAFDDGGYKPSLYSGDDGFYKDDQYAPNTDASYQFEFDVGDHGRQEAADVDGEVEGNFYAVHPDGLRRDVEFTAGVDGFVVTKDESVQGPVPEYALRAAEKPKKEYPPAEIRTSLSDDGIYHWEYDAGESSRSEDINLNTNYYEGTFDFTADDDQNRYRVDYVAGAGIGFVPTGDHLPQQVEETPEVAAAKQDFLEKYAVIEAEAKAARKNGYQQANQAQAAAYQQANRQRPNNFQGQASGQGFRPQSNNQGFRQQQNNNQGYSAARPQAQNQGFRPQNNNQGFRQQGNNQGYSASRPQAQSPGFRPQNNNQNFKQQGNNQGYSAPRPQNNQGIRSQSQQGFKPQNNNQGFRQQGSGPGYSASRPQSQSFSRPQNNQHSSGQRQSSPYNPGYSASQSKSQTFIPTAQAQGRPHSNQQQPFRQQAGSGSQGYSAHQQQSLRPAGNRQQQGGSGGFQQPARPQTQSYSAAGAAPGRPHGGAPNTQYSGAESGQSFNQLRPQTSAADAANSNSDEEVPQLGYSYLPPN